VFGPVLSKTAAITLSGNKICSYCRGGDPTFSSTACCNIAGCNSDEPAPCTPTAAPALTTSAPTQAPTAGPTINVAPIVAVNAGLRVTEGHSATILPANLNSTDYPHENTSLIFYTVSTGPEHGKLTRNSSDSSAPVVVTFTQWELDRGHNLILMFFCVSFPRQLSF
jgi:hypothetical protein